MLNLLAQHEYLMAENRIMKAQQSYPCDRRKLSDAKVKIPSAQTLAPPRAATHCYVENVGTEVRSLRQSPPRERSLPPVWCGKSPIVPGVNAQTCKRGTSVGAAALFSCPGSVWFDSLGIWSLPCLFPV